MYYIKNALETLPLPEIFENMRFPLPLLLPLPAPRSRSQQPWIQGKFQEFGQFWRWPDSRDSLGKEILATFLLKWRKSLQI
jgi:hypothetical protein